MSYKKKIEKAEVRKDNTLSLIRFFISIRKEKAFLEEMALKGWFFSDLKLGVKYIFTKGEPKKMIYEVDRFNLPKNPTIKDIMARKNFIETAYEMGWEVITHDETLIYYFGKEYKEGEINELYNDFESREIRANKFYDYFISQTKNYNTFIIIFLLAGIVFDFSSKVFSKNLVNTSMFYSIFVIGFILSNCYVLNIAQKTKKELLMTTEEWENLNLQNKNIKKEEVSYSSIKKIISFLEEESENGWQLENVIDNKYFFKKDNSIKYSYNIDTQELLKKRINKTEKEALSDTKDFFSENNEWQVKSLEYAKNNGWSFACALSNIAIIYRSKSSDKKRPINDSKGNIIYINFDKALISLMITSISLVFLLTIIMLIIEIFF